jgi:hypothetical protein
MDLAHIVVNKFTMVMTKTNTYLTKKKQTSAKLAFTKTPNILVSTTNLQTVFNKISIILDHNHAKAMIS